jgi:hypothetical protein
MPVIEKYFGRIPKKPLPDPLRTVEPPQNAEREAIIHDPGQPIYLEGYHRPAITDPDNATYDTISMLMSAGRTSRLYRSLVRDKKLAAQAGGFNGFPGQKYPNMFVFYGVTTPQHAATDLEKPIADEIDRLKTQDVPADELQSVKTRVKANLLRQLDKANCDVRLFVTLGSPLGITEVQDAFREWVPDGVLPFPKCVSRWVNVADPLDPVAFDKRLDGEFAGGAIEVQGLVAERIGDLAAANGVTIHELTPQQASLEEAFMDLTREDLEYRAHELEEVA